MNSEEGFLHTIRQEYENDEPRLIFADWLDDQGEFARADLIRLQCHRAILPDRDSEIPRLDAKIKAILNEHQESWTGTVPSSISLTMDRGLFHVAMAPTTKRSFSIEISHWWKQYQPWIASVSLSGNSRALGKMIQAGYFDSVSRLSLKDFSFHNENDFNHLLRLSNVKQLELAPMTPLNESNVSSLGTLNGLQFLALMPEATPHQQAGLSDFPHLPDLARLQLRLELNEENAKRLVRLPFLCDLTISVYGNETENLQLLGQMKNLERLYIYNGHDPRTQLRHLAQVDSLRRFLISHILLAADTVESVSVLEQIEELRLCPTERVGEDWMKHLKPLKRLKSIDFSESSFIEQGSFNNLAKLRQLETLNLDRTSFTRIGLKSLSTLTSLKRLFLACNPLTGRDMRYLRPLTQLESLDLRSSKVTDVGLTHLAQMKNLRWIDLRRTEVTEQKVEKLREALPEAIIEFDPKKRRLP